MTTCQSLCAIEGFVYGVEGVLKIKLDRHLEARALTLEGCSSSEVLLVFQHWKDRGENEKEKRENKYESSLRKRTSPAQPIRQSHNSVATGFFFELLVATRVFLVFKRPTGTDRSGSYRRPGGPGVGSPALVKNRENTLHGKLFFLVFLERAGPFDL